eukprot:TRINITY_DN18401_c0_g1_i1.p1 TRINITY_DN18401_c0_g1~~TRINITY_DN18401_c0_g1_i1.p1  ORF type:complete len:574 (+),score=192.11 TRINITY_DN18401_c0_g1_i1:75-1724(+)
MSIDVTEDLFDELQACDGVLGAFFTLLWTKQTSRRQHVLTGIYIPDTIIYQYSKPLFWYFTAKDGTVKRKLRGRLNCGYIEEQFLRHGKSACGVVGQHITNPPDGVGAGEAALSYATRHELRSFLQGEGRHGRQSGLLQLFFDPRPSPDGSLHNALVQATWSPNCFVVDKRVNRCKMTDDKLPLARRLATFDDLSISDAAPTISTSLRDTLFDACSRVAEHIEILFSYRVANLVIHFKVDVNDTPWMLWCSALRIAQWDNPHRSLTVSLAPPATEAVRAQRERKQSVRRRRVERLRRNSAKAAASESCPLCERPDSAVASVPRHAALFGLSVLDHFHNPETRGTQYDATRTLELSADGQVPRCVSLVCPGLSGQQYSEARQHDWWQQQRVRVCHDCLSTLIHLTEAIRVDDDGQIRRPFGSPRSPQRSMTAMELREDQTTGPDSPATATTRAATSLGGPAPHKQPKGSGVPAALPPLRADRRPPPPCDDSEGGSTYALSEVPTSVATRQSNLVLSGRLRQRDLRVPDYLRGLDPAPDSVAAKRNPRHRR